MKTLRNAMVSCLFSAVYCALPTAFAGAVPAQMAPVAIPGMAAVAQAHLVGHHDPAATLNVDVILEPRNEAQLQSAVAAVQNPESPQYHQFLTPEQFTAQYSPTTAQVAEVENYLKSQGLTVTDVAPDRLAIHVKAPSGTFESAFGIQINDYTYRGRRGFAPTGAPQLPVAIAGEVTTILGLNDVVRPHSMLIKPSPDVANVTYTPQQIMTAYDWPTESTPGAGITIANATADSAGFSASDSDTFWSHYGLPSHLITIVPVGTVTTVDGIEETTLDEEWAGAMAPGANLMVYDGNSTFLGLYEVYSAIINDNQAQVMTTSWGAAESAYAANKTCNTQTGNPGPGSTNCITPDSTLFNQAAMQGITVVAAAGDHGSSDGTTSPEEADFPSSDPNVVAAGGTSLLLNSNDARTSETVWNDGSGEATGGAISQMFAEPAWQTGEGVPQNGYRNTSDLSMDADPNTGYSFYDGSWTSAGGTSFVAPELAGLFADFVSFTGGQRLGAAAPIIYADANSSTYASDFYDVTSGNNGDFSANTGWDHPTGWGTPTAIPLLTHMDGGIALSPPFVAGLEFLGCRYGAAQYLVNAQAGDVGSPQEWELQLEQTGGEWVTLSDGPGVNPSLTVAGGKQWQLRLRGYSGVFWTPWTYRSFHSPSCQGGPPK